MAGVAVGVVFLVVVLVFVLIIALAFIGWYISTSNAINRVNLKIEEALSGVEIMLRQRYDVLMQGKKIAEQYAQHEQRVFEGLRHLTQIPTKATVAQLNQAAVSQEEVVKSFFALGEAYPELKSAEIFNNLINQLAQQSQQYSASRRAVNGNITKLNNYVVSFPSSIICNSKGITKMDYIHEENINELKNIDMTMNF